MIDVFVVAEDSVGASSIPFKPWAVLEFINGHWSVTSRHISWIAADKDCRKRNREVEAGRNHD